MSHSSFCGEQEEKIKSQIGGKRWETWLTVTERFIVLIQMAIPVCKVSFLLAASLTFTVGLKSQGLNCTQQKCTALPHTSEIIVALPYIWDYFCPWLGNEWPFHTACSTQNEAMPSQLPSPVDLEWPKSCFLSSTVFILVVVCCPCSCKIWCSVTIPTGNLSVYRKAQVSPAEVIVRMHEEPLPFWGHALWRSF